MERHGFWPLGLSLFLRFPGLDSFRHVLIELRVRIVGKSWRCWSVHNAYIRQWLSSRTRRALVGLSLGVSFQRWLQINVILLGYSSDS